jgi:DNA-binding response OmpR family regulator
VVRVRVLVVSEDVKERLRASSALLLHADAEVVEATSAEEARRLLLVDGEDFDVLVVDGDLQPRGGYALLYDLRARAELAELAAKPSLVMASRPQDRWLAGWAGANEMMLKPVDPFLLAKRVDAIAEEELASYGDHASAARQVAAATRDHR